MFLFSPCSGNIHVQKDSLSEHQISEETLPNGGVETPANGENGINGTNGVAAGRESVSTTSLNSENVLLRGSRLKNTPQVYGEYKLKHVFNHLEILKSFTSVLQRNRSKNYFSCLMRQLSQ